MAHSAAAFSLATWTAKARCSAKVADFGAAAMTDHQHHRAQAALVMPVIFIFRKLATALRLVYGPSLY